MSGQLGGNIFQNINNNTLPKESSNESIFNGFYVHEKSGIALYKNITILPELSHQTCEDLRMEYYKNNNIFYKDDEIFCNAFKTNLLLNEKKNIISLGNNINNNQKELFEKDNKVIGLVNIKEKEKINNNNKTLTGGLLGNNNNTQTGGLFGTNNSIGTGDLFGTKNNSQTKVQLENNNNIGNGALSGTKNNSQIQIISGTNNNTQNQDLIGTNNNIGTGSLFGTKNIESNKTCLLDNLDNKKVDNLQIEERRNNNNSKKNIIKCKHFYNYVSYCIKDSKVKEEGGLLCYKCLYEYHKDHVSQCIPIEINEFENYKTFYKKYISKYKSNLKNIFTEINSKLEKLEKEEIENISDLLEEKVDLHFELPIEISFYERLEIAINRKINKLLDNTLLNNVLNYNCLNLFKNNLNELKFGLNNPYSNETIKMKSYTNFNFTKNY